MQTFLASFDGGNALTPFRSQQLLAHIQQIAPKVRAIGARFIHWVESDRPLDAASQQQSDLKNIQKQLMIFIDKV